MRLSDLNFRLTLSKKTELLYYLHAGWLKKGCIFRFPRQPPGRIVACADWLTQPVSQTNNQLEAATRGTKNAFLPVVKSQIKALCLKWFIFYFNKASSTIFKQYVIIFIKNLKRIRFSNTIKR